MITAIVQFDLPKDIDRHKAEETFKKIAPLYQSMDGLIQKYFCFTGLKYIFLLQGAVG